MSLPLSAIPFLNRRIKEIQQNPQTSPCCHSCTSLTPANFVKSRLSPRRVREVNPQDPIVPLTTPPGVPISDCLIMFPRESTHNLSGFLISPKTKWQTALPICVGFYDFFLCFSISPTLPLLSPPAVSIVTLVLAHCLPGNPLLCTYFITWFPTLILWFISNLSNCNITPLPFFPSSPPAPSTFNFQMSVSGKAWCPHVPGKRPYLQLQVDSLVFSLTAISSTKSRAVLNVFKSLWIRSGEINRNQERK